MGPGIIIPVVLIAIVVPMAFMWAKKRFKDDPLATDDPAPVAPAARLTSTALRDLDTPGWRVVYEIADDKLDGVEHVLLGPHGVFAIRTSMDPLPEPPSDQPTPEERSRPAIARAALDDALAVCAMSSDALLVVHWGVNADGSPISVDPAPGHTAVDGRCLAEWVGRLEGGDLGPAQVDLAWQTVVTAIGRPDPLA